MRGFFRKTAIRLHVTISLIFVVLTLPVMVTFVVVSYRANLSLSERHSERFVEKSLADTVNVTTRLFNPMLTTVRTAANLMRDQPDYFRQESSADYLADVVSLNEAVYAAYASFADGSFRQLRRNVADAQVLGRAPPADARFVSRFLDARKKGGPVDTYTFHAAWGKRIGEYAGPASYDPRVRGFYLDSLRLKTANISDPYLFASSGELGVTASAPVFGNGVPIGVFAADITLKTLSEYLSINRVSANGITIIADAGGGVVAHPNFDQVLTRNGAELVQNRLEKLPDPRIKAALAERLRTGNDRFRFHVGGVEYLGIFSPFPPDFKKGWELLIIAPTDDFIGEIRRTNRYLLLFGGGALLLQILLILRLSRSISRPIEQLADEVTHIREFHFDQVKAVNSRVHEIKCLADAVDLLNSGLQSFTSYVPKGLVRQLVASGQGTGLGVQSRYLTMLFTDLENFSTLTENEPSQELLSRVSEYFSIVTHAIEQECGTVDKFIGDAVMAFWGAPVAIDDHAYLACVAAVRAQRGMAAKNAEWAALDVAPLRVRIGIHADAALVGNVGSPERISYTVMGDGVNVAARLEGINKDMGTWTCVSHNIYRECGERLWLRPIDTVTVKGRKAELLIYELLAIRGAGPELEATPEEVRLCELTGRAYAEFAKSNFEAAAEGYRAVLKAFPDDRVATRMLGKCAAASRPGALPADNNPPSGR